MHPFFPFRNTCIALIFFGAASLSAQSSAELHQFDKRIDFFFDSNQRDSFLYYIGLKTEMAKRADSLALWAWSRFNTQLFLSDNSKEALNLIEETFATKWRNAVGALEFEPFLYLLVYQANYYKDEGKLLHSSRSYQDAIPIYEQFRYEDFSIVESIFKPLGNHYSRLGENDKAIAVFQKALAVGESNEELSGLYSNIGIAYWNMGNYPSAEENYLKGLSLSGIGNTERGLLLARLAETMLDMGRSSEAALTAAKAIQLLRPDGPKDTRTREFRARARRIAGKANTILGKFPEAKRLLDGALADDRACSKGVSREVGKDHIALSTLFLRQAQPLQALQAADFALAAVIPNFNPSPSNHPNPSSTLFYEENTLFEALNAKARAAKAMFEKTDDIAWLELALECHELAWQAESILRRVFQYSSSKLTLQKDTRIREEEAMTVVRLLFEKTGKIVWLEKAFIITERSKAALLLEALQDNLVRQRLSGSDPRFDELTALRQSLSDFDKNLLLKPQSDRVPQWRIEADGLREQIAALDQTLRLAYPSLSGLETNTANWLPTAGDFAEGEVVAGYFVSEHWVDVFVFQKDKPGVWHRIPNEEDLQSLIRSYLAFFENDYAILNDPNGYFQTAYTLWQKILPPETTSASVLTILPDGMLNFVPFEALVTTTIGSPTLRNAAYLLRKQEVRYAWSLAVLRKQKNLKSRASNYLLSIAPGFENRERGLAPLASADFDWQGIAGWDIQSLSGQKAEIQHFLKEASGYRVLHFSTHAFASGNPRIEFMDGSLLLPDLYALPLQADLVMLSACETGLGKEEKGEGVMSLARAFAQAGAACIVSSLWSVNDQSTSRLVHYFYKNIRQGQTSGAALREAKLAYLSDSEVGSAAQSPYFWAGLVAVGDDRVIEQPWGWGMWGILVGGDGFAFDGMEVFTKKQDLVVRRL
ncbi:MAG: CHAT domain-containing protein [Saprospiraceae bacterium]